MRRWPVLDLGRQSWRWAPVDMARSGNGLDVVSVSGPFVVVLGV